MMQAVAVNRSGKYFRLEDDRVIPFCSMMDINGNDTDDPAECVIALFQIPEGEDGAGKYSGADLREFDDDMQETVQ